jgi:carboxylesterase type B
VDGVIYPAEPEGYSAYWWAAQRSNGDLSFSCASRRTAQNLAPDSASSGRASSNFLYLFEHLTASLPYVYHTAELPYVFQAAGADAFTPYLTEDEDVEVARLVGSYWGSFIVDPDHDPNAVTFGIAAGGSKRASSQAEWLPFAVGSDSTLDFAQGVAGAATVSAVKKNECDFLLPFIDTLVRADF